MAVGRGTSIAIALVLAVVLAALCVGVAGAAEERQPAGTREDPYRAAYFQVAGTDGYSVGVIGVPAGEENGEFVLVMAWNRHSSSYYAAPGRVDSGGFSGDLGRFGRVSVRFRPRGVKRITSRCGRRSAFGEAGRFVGSFAFHPLGGYTNVPARRLSIESSYRTPLECASTHLEHGGPGVLLHGFGRDGNVDVSQPRAGAPVRILVETGAEFGRVGMERTEEFFVPASALAWTAKPAHATLSPPPPFSGAATYSTLKDGRSRWLGDLKVDLSGTPGLRLTDDDSVGFFMRGSCRVSGRLPGDPPVGGCLF